MSKRIPCVASLLFLLFLLGCGPSTPDTQRIKADLYKRSTENWTFQGGETIKALTIKKVDREGPLVTMQLEIKAEQAGGGRRLSGPMTIVYRHNGQVWELLDISTSSASINSGDQGVIQSEARRVPSPSGK